jgi:hypothetical protein
MMDNDEDWHLGQTIDTPLERKHQKTQRQHTGEKINSNLLRASFSTDIVQI